MSRQPLLIVGASGRAAAASALRAGLDPFVLDLFADADTERLCPVHKLPMADYPHGFVALAKHLPPMPWMYTGGLENYPDVVAAIAATRELWGNGPDVLAKVRDPLAVSARFRQYPACVLPGRELPPPKNWLRKPLRGSAGHGVRSARPEDLTVTTGRPDYYLQEFVEGRPMSAVFVPGRPHWPTFVGMTHQLIGTPWLHAKSFAYAGNIFAHPRHGPDIRPKARLFDMTFPLVGIWGLDFINRPVGSTAVIEVNPRYTASVEVIEYVLRAASLTQAFRSEPSTDSDDRSCSLPPWGGGLGWGVSSRQGEGHSPGQPRTPLPNPPLQGGREQEVANRDRGYPAGDSRFVGKAIYYAPHALTFPPSGPWDESLANCPDVWRRPDFADIPHAGDEIAIGQPVCTIFAEAATEADCEKQLRTRAAELDRLFKFDFGVDA